MSKYIRLMADFCSDAVWDENGASVDINSLPIHHWLKNMIDDWQAWYDREGFDDNFDLDLFGKHGFALAVKLKQNLPDWTIMYFNESKIQEGKSRSEALKEIIL